MFTHTHTHNLFDKILKILLLITQYIHIVENTKSINKKKVTDKHCSHFSISFHILLYAAPFFGEGNGNPLQYSCLENPMDGGAWWATFHGVAKSRTQLSDFIFTFLLLFTIKLMKDQLKPSVLISISLLVLYIWICTCVCVHVWTSTHVICPVPTLRIFFIFLL